MFVLLVAMNIVNKPEISKWLAGFYGGTAVFVAVVVGVAFYFSVQASAISAAGAVVLIFVLGFVEGVMIWLAVSVNRTTYILTDNELILKAPRLIGGNKSIPLETIESVHRTLIPFGVRLFGASFYGGYYYFPNVGKAFMVITNFKDGVLIKAQHGNYVITPRKPEDLIENIKKMKTKAVTKT
jgi:hypothetical protein